jgi:hypothetical protein
MKTLSKYTSLEMFVCSSVIGTILVLLHIVLEGIASGR